MSAGNAAYPVSGTRRAYTVGLLTAIFTLGFLDRQIINILAEPIKRDLRLGDGQLGLLTGLSFALFYAVLGLPIARLADRSDRGQVIAASLAVWSVFTIVCGRTGGFGSLLLARIGVGVGEAGCNPPAASLIADIVPPGRRASAMAVYSLGNPLGSMIGLAFGGLIAGAFGWRAAFLLAGLPGIAVAVLAWFTLGDPRRTDRSAAAPPLSQALRQFAAKPSFWLLGGGAALMAFVSYGKVAFYGSFFLRNHADGLDAAARDLAALTGVSLTPIGLLGLLLGLLLGMSGAFGMVLGGRLADRAARRGPAAYMTAPALAAAAQVPFFVAALVVPGFWASMLLFCVPAVLTTFWFGPVLAVVTGIVEPRNRSTAGAAMQLVINLVGLGLGPLVVGLLSQAFSGGGGGGDGDSLRTALAICSAAGLVAAALFHHARRHIPFDMVG